MCGLHLGNHADLLHATCPVTDGWLVLASLGDVGR